MLALRAMSGIGASAMCRKLADLQGTSTLAARGWSRDEVGDSNATHDWWRTLCMPDARLVRLDVGISSKWHERVLQRSMSTRAESSASIEEPELTAAIWSRQGMHLSCRPGACAVP
ncbi:hypothetical protein P353_04975 [Comamonas testosteroni]|uniref:Uncharacterized protein n=1 Tax=Comamonas testosteroni TaxID=285 RepID=A0A096FPD4_COMTE|nr:hypothetical protein P353_04975 [Comamonas testosteroni]